MKRPERKVEIFHNDYEEGKLDGYNQGRQDMIDFLPSEEEILNLIEIHFADSQEEAISSHLDLGSLASAISERLRGEI